MNILDIILLLCLIPALFSGLKKGFIAQVIAIIALVLGSFACCALIGTASNKSAQIHIIFKRAVIIKAGSKNGVSATGIVAVYHCQLADRYFVNAKIINYFRISK